jgi:hypothetical protein
MPDAVYRMLTLLCRVVITLPVGTNLGMLHLLWMLVSGQLLASRGAVLPALSACGLRAPAVRRAWAALGQGDWTSATLLARWATVVHAEGHWQPHTHGGYQPVAVDVTAFFRPRLRGCPTTPYQALAGKELPAIPVGLIARVGQVGTQRLALPLAFVRAAADEPSTSAHQRALVRAAVAHCADDDVLLFDAGFGMALLQEEGATRFVVRCAKNSTFRRATPPPYRGRGRIPTRGLVVRPLPRPFKGRTVAATPPDRTTTWEVAGVVLRADLWDDLVLPDASAGSPTITVVAVHDPRYRDPLLLATPLPLGAPVLRALPRPLACRAPALGRQTDARRRPRLRARPRNLPAAAGTGAAGRRASRVCGGHGARGGHRLLGSPPAAHAGAAAPRARLRPFSARLPAPCTTTRKGLPHGPPAHRVLGATAPSRSRPRQDAALICSASPP